MEQKAVPQGLTKNNVKAINTVRRQKYKRPFIFNSNYNNTNLILKNDQLENPNQSKPFLAVYCPKGQLEFCLGEIDLFLAELQKRW